MMLPRYVAVAICIGSSLAASTLAADIQSLPIFAAATEPPADYLVEPIARTSQLFRSDDGRDLVLDNGLIRRTWRIKPNLACIGFDNVATGQAMLRSIRPEAHVTIDGRDYAVGGLQGQPINAFLMPKWIDQLQVIPGSLRYVDFEVGPTAERFAWGKRRHHAPGAKWPPPGVHLQLHFQLPGDQGQGIGVTVHYEMYDGVPVMCKWMTVRNDGSAPIMVDRFVAEELALVETANWVEARDGVALPPIDYLHVETDFAFGGFNHQNANRHVIHWLTDPTYKTQTNYKKATPCLLKVNPTYGPAQEVAVGGEFATFRTFELAYDGGDRERRGLALRRMYRTVAPWVTENPLTHHLLSSNPDQVRTAIDQAKEVGFEAIILSFGSGFNMESEDEAYLAKWKAVADYADKQGIELGSYSLFSSRRIGGGDDIVPPPGETLTHGACPAATSPWGIKYYEKLHAFFPRTGFDQFENDGPYPGDVDVTSRPPLQKGIEDSRWAQWRIVTNLYQDLRAQGVYINAPDFYYLSGSNKCGMGYRETNWSLPREQQRIIARQNIYDGTWEKTPSMGWMFVPLAQYHGGGAAATVEPLHEHLDHYESMLQANLGAGVQAHYRGPRLFDTDETRELVKKWTDWFKRYRDILESDVIHGRRADSRDVDWLLHVNSQLREKGMLCVYNPLDHDVQRTLRVPLYYAGLAGKASIAREDQDPQTLAVGRDGAVLLPIAVKAGQMAWYVIRSADDPAG